MDTRPPNFKELYDLVCKNVEELTMQSQAVALALYEYILTLNDVDLWKPTDTEERRETMWKRAVGSYFRAYDVKHRKEVCHILSRRIARELQNNNNADSNLPEEIILALAKMIAKVDKKTLGKVARLNKTWNRIVDEVVYKELETYVTNFFTNLIYYKALGNDIAIFSSSKVKHLIDPDGPSSFVTDQQKHDYVYPLIYIVDGNIIYNDSVEESKEFLEYLQDATQFKLIKYYDASDSEMYVQPFAALLQKLYGDVKVPLLVTQRQIFRGPKLEDKESVFMTNPKKIVEAMLKQGDNLQFAINLSDLFEYDDDYLKARQKLGLLDGVWRKSGSPTAQTYYTRIPVFGEHFPLEVVDGHDVIINRTYNPIKYPFFFVGVNRVVGYIKRNMESVRKNPWFTQNSVDLLLSGTGAQEGGPTKYRVADEVFLGEFLKDCETRKNSYSERDWRVPSLAEETN